MGPGTGERQELSPGRLVLRGILGRCPRCGSGGIFRGYFKLREHCPRCEIRFVREEGAFTGAILMNFVATLTLMILPLMVYVLWRGVTGDDDLAFRPFAVACVGLALLVPLLFYPLSASWWTGMDMAMRPLEHDEVHEAQERVAARSDHGRQGQV